MVCLTDHILYTVAGIDVTAQWWGQVGFGEDRELSRDEVLAVTKKWRSPTAYAESTPTEPPTMRAHAQDAMPTKPGKRLHPVKKQRIEELEKLYQAGSTQEEVAEHLQISVKTVQRYAKGQGLKWEKVS